ncbi:MAG: hypothetical protein J6I62_02830 [Selenomonadaceae bacterium]|nr:hypothetical protein [Selenomonadaceae bacterium]
MIRNALLVMLSIIFLVTAGSLTYVFYYNTKAQIAEDKEKRIAEMPPKEEPKTLRDQIKQKQKEKEDKLKAKKEAEKRGNKVDAEDEAKEDIAHLVQDMYITPLSANDRAYEYEEHDDAGIFLHPYVIEHKGGATTLHLKAGNRGGAPMNFDTIVIKCDSGEKQLKFPAGGQSSSAQGGLAASFYDVQAAGDIENIMHAIAGSNYVQVAISGHEEENKILSPSEIKQFRNIMLLYDELKGSN